MSQSDRHDASHGVPVRLAKPRIAPVNYDQATAAQRQAIDAFGLPQPVLNIFATLAQAPEALNAFRPWGGYVLSPDNSLPAREREIVILRVGARCRSGYEFTQHWRIGLHAGLSEAEMTRIRDGSASDWPAPEAALIRACDDIVTDQFVSDASWTALAAHFTERQVMDVVFTASEYVMVSTMLSSFGVQVEEAPAA
ncbi:carboxymuconolactone decarboxylase family protein [uncultured Sphingomonas sp.]|uniref:carboxymuconolactone decarboxylase family protein n=1 Tax=uncultured Sphingomonas sp. TaxID=158754 RepID=UPI0026286E76|nr:carboxymuconolactone decarboxylase family protein [uncultured Sphingomonas sp.]